MKHVCKYVIRKANTFIPNKSSISWKALEKIVKPYQKETENKKLLSLITIHFLAQISSSTSETKLVSLKTSQLQSLTGFSWWFSWGRCWVENASNFRIHRESGGLSHPIGKGKSLNQSWLLRGCIYTYIIYIYIHVVCVYAVNIYIYVP